MKMMTLEEAKDYTREALKQYYSKEAIEELVAQCVKVDRPGVVLTKSKTKSGRLILWNLKHINKI